MKSLMLPSCETSQLSHGTEMAPEKTTDSVRCGIWLDPVILKAIDAARKTDTRGKFILKTVAKALKLKEYTPRTRGKPKKEEQ